MTPFHFGNSEHRLFGIYDPPRFRPVSTRAVVLCHPSGDEHIHAYRTMRLLADHLSQNGIHVLRFDYFGTGDSGGECTQANVAEWHRDVLAAIAELKDMTQTARVSLIGLRAGANIAARVAACHPHEIHDLVLWQPLVVQQGRAPVGSDDEGMLERDCTTAGDCCREGMWDVSSHAGQLPDRTLVVISKTSRRPAQLGGLTIAQLDGVCPWVEERTTTGTVPVEVIRHIGAWLR